MIRPLVELTEADAVTFGNKAASLGRLARAGLPVPAGFATTTPIDRDEVARAYRALGEPAVAVRSSAAGEDSSEASFAGQLETALDVRGLDAVLEAIDQCVVSARAARVALYGDSRSVEAGALGVVVQTMVPAELAGVCFTRSPDDPERIIIEWVVGLGDALVSGRARGQRAVLRRDLTVESSDGDGSVGEALRRVAEGALMAERAFGHALDVEWAVVDGQPRFLQARPITGGATRARLEALRQEEIGRLRKVGPALWTDFSIGDALPQPSPLLMDCFRRAASKKGALGKVARTLGLPYAGGPETRQIFDLICGKAFINLTRYVASGAVGLPITPTLLRDDGPLVRKSAKDIPVRMTWRWPGWRALRVPDTLARLIVVVPRRVLAVRRALSRDYARRLHPRVEAEAARERARDLSTLTLPQLWERFEAYARRLNEDQAHLHLLCDFLSGACDGAFRNLLTFIYGDEGEEMAYLLATGLPGNFNTDANLALADVARGRRTLASVQDEYGHRGWPDWDPAAPRWREAPERLSRLVERIRASGEDPRARFEAQAEKRREAERRFARDVARHPLLRFAQGPCLRELRYYQRAVPLRELTQAACYLWVELARRVVLEASRRLGARDLPFFLTLPRLKALLHADDPAPLLAEARAARERTRLLRTIYVPHLLSSDRLEEIGRPPALDATRALEGLPVSRGVVRGKVRVATHLADAHDLQPGEVLVVEFTDPAWTPLFFIAGGLVLEQGSMLSHGAIIAREYGLPAIVNVPHATRALKTGQEVVLDADRGRVYVP